MPPRPAPVTPPHPPPAPVPQPAANELRGMWVSDTTRLDWNQATASLQRAGFNAMFVNLASAGAAFYPHSRVLPSLVDGDDVARGIVLAHQRGIAVHAKLIALFLFKSPPEFQRRLIKAGRVMRGLDGKPALQNGDAWLCPSQPANRALLTGAVTEMLTRYPVDGLHVDYIRFFEEPTCYCAHCRQSFEAALGHKLKHWPADVSGGAHTAQFIEWKRQIINSCLHEISATARRLRPGLPVSAAVFHDLERGREDRAQDWRAWLDRGDVDYVCTMSYTPDLTDFENRIRRQQTWAPRQRVVIGIGSYKFHELAPLLGEIAITRRLGAPGFVLFSWDDSVARNFLPNLTTAR